MIRLSLLCHLVLDWAIIHSVVTCACCLWPLNAHYPTQPIRPHLCPALLKWHQNSSMKVVVTHTYYQISELPTIFLLISVVGNISHRLFERKKKVLKIVGYLNLGPDSRVTVEARGKKMGQRHQIDDTSCLSLSFSLYLLLSLSLSLFLCLSLKRSVGRWGGATPPTYTCCCPTPSHLIYATSLILCFASSSLEIATSNLQLSQVGVTLHFAELDPALRGIK